MEILTLDQLPQAVSKLLDKVCRIEDILKQDRYEDKNIENLFLIKQVATFLDLSISAIYGKVCRREIPVSKQEKRLYLNKAELLDRVQAGRKHTTAEVTGSVSLSRMKHA